MRRSVAPQEWQRQAACLGSDPNLFFPDTAEGEEADTEAIRAYCGGCRVHQECFEHALAREEWGYWAATSPTLRRKLRTKLKIKLDPPGVEDAWLI